GRRRGTHGQEIHSVDGQKADGYSWAGAQIRSTGERKGVRVMSWFLI
ncbi:hypothetical protein LEMLEM_LOCUS22506, partial [Lemmus lemmus]